MFSIIIPLDSNRLEQFKNTKRIYDGMPQRKEFIIPTRSEPELRKFFDRHNLWKDVRIIPYIHEVGFNCSKALNIGVSNAKYPYIIITSPEVKPLTPVLEQLEKLLGTNIICKVWNQDQNNNIKGRPLISSRLEKSKNPQMYFLAMFNKEDIEKINGWDEEFMKGYAYEDCDFGARWTRAGIPFVVRDDITALNQYHPRVETIPGGSRINLKRFEENNKAGIIKCSNGLKKL